MSLVSLEHQHTNTNTGTEQELFDSNFTVTAKSNQLEVEESAARELRDELRDREGKRVRNEHTHKLNKFILARLGCASCTPLLSKFFAYASKPVILCSFLDKTKCFA